MSGRIHNGARSPAVRRAHASVFAALGDETRLSLLAKLGHGQRCSISELTEGSALTRQAITKHLRVLERVKVVRCVRSGRESLFELDPQPVQEVKEYLDLISLQWEQAFSSLKAFVEEEHPD
jgi:DNA-binding transcriptional ArsR family regulator